MIGYFRKRPRDGAVRPCAGTDWWPYYGVFYKWTKISCLCILPLMNCLTGLCGWPNYFQYRYALKGNRRLDVYRCLLLLSSIPVGWRRQAYDYMPEF